VLEYLRPAAVVAALMLFLAPYVGMLWEWIAPAPTYVNIKGEVFLDNQDSSEFIAADGWFLVIGLLVGIACAALGYWRWRGNLAVIVAMTGASILAALIARQVGEAFAPAPIQQTASTLVDGGTVHGSIRIAADGVLLAWPVGILLTYLSLIGGLERTRGEEEEPDPDQVGWEQPSGWGPSDGTNGTEQPSVRAGGLASDVGAGQGRQVGQHDPLPAEKGELGP
jgi:hypothetical protein